MTSIFTLVKSKGIVDRLLRSPLSAVQKKLARYVSMKDKEIKKTCDEITAVVNVMRRANATGDDVRIEIDSGLNLLESIVSDLRSKEE